MKFEKWIFVKIRKPGAFLMLSNGTSSKASKSALLVCLEFKQEKLHGGTLRTYATYKTLKELGYEVEVVQLNETSNEPRSNNLRKIKRTLFPLPFKKYRVTRKKILEVVLHKEISLVVCNWQPMMSACTKLNLPVWLDFMDDWKTISKNEVGEKNYVSKVPTILQGYLWKDRQKRYSKASSTFLSCAGYADSKNLSAKFLPTPVDRKVLSLNEDNRDFKRERFRLGFIGNFMYRPNRLGVEKFLKEFNLKKSKQLTFCIAGYSADEVSKDYIHNLGEGENVYDFYKKIDGVVCPIYNGGGIKVKAIEGMIYGFRVFATEHVMSGFPDNLQNFFNPN